MMGEKATGIQEAVFEVKHGLDLDLKTNSVVASSDTAENRQRSHRDAKGELHYISK